MKKILAILLALVMAIGLLAGCTKSNDGESTALAGGDTVITILCDACKQEVEWTAWTKTDSLPAEAGHFYLADNVKVISTTILDQASMCLDLNGKTITQTVDGNRVYRITNSTLNIIDSSADGSGVIYPASALKFGSEAWGQGVDIGPNAALNLYSGTIDASNVAAQYSCCVHISADTSFNMYGGKLIGGTTWGSGGAVLVAIGTFNMEGGIIVGGKVESALPVGGGGAIRVTGTMNFNGGSITGGSTNKDGGCIRVASGASLYISEGAVLSGGKADGQGNNIYIQEGGKYFPHKDLVIDGVYDANTSG